jgi:ArsR family metal-binding transcriptional regulator
MPVIFLDAIALIRTQPCLADPGRIIVIGKPSRTLEPVIPYLATLPGVISYNPESCTLTFRRQPGFLTIYPEQVMITQVKDTAEGLELLAALTDAVNSVWDQRDQLSPIKDRRTSARPLDIWKLLPQTNCGQCDEATCMAFAFLLIQGKKALDDCPALQNDPEFASRGETIEEIVR